MASLTQGAPLPDITQTTTKTQTVPDYYTQYLQDLSTAGQTAMGRSAAEGVAPMDVLQTQGYGMVPGAATAYQPGLTAAGQTAASVAGGIDPNRISALMDPYQRQVVDEMARLQQQNIQRSVLPSLKGAFVGSGGLGSQRYAAATGQTLADMQRNLTGQQYGALSTGYQNAMKAALDEARIRDQAAQTQAAIAGKEQEFGLTGAGALTKAGAERQAYEQAIRDYPLKQATSAAALMRGFQVPTGSSEVFKGPKAGLYQTSPLANITGLLTTLGSIRPGSVTYDKDGRPIAGDSLLKMGIDYLKNLNFPVFNSSGQPMTPDEAASWWGGFDTSNTYVPGSGGGGEFEGNVDVFPEGDQYFYAKGGLSSIRRR